MAMLFLTCVFDYTSFSSHSFSSQLHYFNIGSNIGLRRSPDRRYSAENSHASTAIIRVADWAAGRRGSSGIHRFGGRDPQSQWSR